MHGHQLLIQVLKIVAATSLRMFYVVSVFNMGLLLQTFSVHICANVKGKSVIRESFPPV